MIEVNIDIICRRLHQNVILTLNITMNIDEHNVETTVKTITKFQIYTIKETQVTFYLMIDDLLVMAQITLKCKLSTLKVHTTFNFLS